jgi:hypothetical protein
VDSRILTYKLFPEDRPKAMAELERSTRIQQEI